MAYVLITYPTCFNSVFKLQIFVSPIFGFDDCVYKKRGLKIPAYVMLGLSRQFNHR